MPGNAENPLKSALYFCRAVYEKLPKSIPSPQTQTQTTHCPTKRSTPHESQRLRRSPKGGSLTIRRGKKTDPRREATPGRSDVASRARRGWSGHRARGGSGALRAEDDLEKGIESGNRKPRTALWAVSRERAIVNDSERY